MARPPKRVRLIRHSCPLAQQMGWCLMSWLSSAASSWSSSWQLCQHLQHASLARMGWELQHWPSTWQMQPRPMLGVVEGAAAGGVTGARAVAGGAAAVVRPRLLLSLPGLSACGLRSLQKMQPRLLQQLRRATQQQQQQQHLTGMAGSARQQSDEEEVEEESEEQEEEEEEEQQDDDEGEEEEEGGAWGEGDEEGEDADPLERIDSEDEADEVEQAAAAALAAAAATPAGRVMRASAAKSLHALWNLPKSYK